VTLAAAIALAVGVAALASGPSAFDAVDGAELSLAGSRMEIAHPPGYPLLLLLLRLGGASTYPGHRVLTSVLAGLAAACVYGAVRSFGRSRPASAGASLLLALSPPVLGQLNLLEVHGLSLLLCGLALMLRRRPAGPYLLGLAVFGGHPASLCLLPAFLGGRCRLSSLALAALPATLLLYIPLRAEEATLLHYTSPDTFGQWISYLGLYGGRVAGPSAPRLLELLGAPGPVAGAALAVALLSGRPRSWRLPMAALLALLFVVSYDVRDLYAYWWLVLLPLAPWLATGLERIRTAGRGPLPMAAVVVAGAVAGLAGAWRSGDVAARRVACDMARGAGPDGIYCTVGHQTFYAAYLLETDDLRPDLVPADMYGNLFGMRLGSPDGTGIPDSLGRRPVYATRGWRSLPLKGLLFTVDGPGLPWDRYEVFASPPQTDDPLARDQLAECWLRRALSEEGEDRMRAFAAADSLASTGETRERIHGLRDR
jgi:hypothetical protein